MGTKQGVLQSADLSVARSANAGYDAVDVSQLVLVAKNSCLLCSFPAGYTWFNPGGSPPRLGPRPPPCEPPADHHIGILRQSGEIIYLQAFRSVS